MEIIGCIGRRKKIEKQGVNLTNILRTIFLYNLFRSLGIYLFCERKLAEKTALKLLVKLNAH
jgi:hypothetical protein